MSLLLPPIKVYSVRSSSKNTSSNDGGDSHQESSYLFSDELSCNDNASSHRPFSSTDLLNALIALLIEVPVVSLVTAASIYNIGETTLKRYQSQITEKLGLPKNSARLIREQFLREYTVESATMFLRNYCFEVRASSHCSRSKSSSETFARRKRVKSGGELSTTPPTSSNSSSSESTLMDEDI